MNDAKPTGAENRLENEAATLSQATLHRMVENAGVGIFQTALDGRFVYANTNLVRLLGYESFAELSAERPYADDFYADPDDQRAVRAVNDAGGRVEGRVHRMRRRDGSVRWVSEHASPILDEAGQVVGYFGTIADVTGLIEAQQKLAEAEASYRRIFERATEGIYRSSLDGRMLRSNPALVRLNGYETEEQHRAAVKDIATEWYVDPTRRDEFKRLLERDGVVENFESEIYRHGTRERIWISENAYLVRDEEGRPLYYEGTVRNITARKKAERLMHEALERAEAANLAKSEFLASISHEFRTPLNAIIGFSNVIRDEIFGQVGNARYKDYADDILNSGHYLLRLISDILDVSAIEAGGVELHEERVRLRSVVDAALHIVSDSAERAGVSIATDIAEGLPDLYGDERRITQILLNLLSNAVKFTGQGGTVGVSAVRTADGGLSVSVMDAGIGMTPEELDKAMTQFGRVRADGAPVQEGTGLGLPLTKGLAELHGAAFHIDSERGRGTTARVVFPAARVMAPG